MAFLPFKVNAQAGLAPPGGRLLGGSHVLQHIVKTLIRHGYIHADEDLWIDKQSHIPIKFCLKKSFVYYHEQITGENKIV